MKINKRKPRRSSRTELDEVICPNCNFKIKVEDIGLVMFKACSVFSCPVCKKTIAIQPKGKEFEIVVNED